MSTIKNWTSKAKHILEGKKIVAVRYLDDNEMTLLGWTKRPVSFQLDDGTLCYLSCDDEGNNGGVLFYQNARGHSALPVL